MASKGAALALLGAVLLAGGLLWFPPGGGSLALPIAGVWVGAVALLYGLANLLRGTEPAAAGVALPAWPAPGAGRAA